ncbi:TPA: hypothetical protein N0F65_008790 [Lagenidium giganteum]|uniref:Sugar phosphate transporter domain-containing protein n=1 Tax=Lagenidium giganteum TaxID=4803 RepID=A0AAV2YYZ2_9STRA|nr:TPA: hypothetical protein N0F65_008790 [Lagenidium giganteum]
MTLFNKWFLRVWEGGYPFATTMTCINILAVPIGLCTALDITFSNLSFFYITVTFYTVVKSGGNVWNLLFSIWLGHQRASFALFSVIILISSGIALASYGSTQFVMQGFLLVIAASIIGTLRWVLTQSLLAEMEESSNRILAVVYYISPASAVGLLPVALLSEGPDFMVSKFTSQPNLLFLSMLFIFVGGCLAFLLIFVEITLVKKTSALSLGIAGSFKDVTQVLLAVSIFGDKLSPVNAFGLMLATSGMLLYTYLKHSAAEGAHGQYSKVPTDQNADALDQLEDDDVPVIKMEEYNGGASSARPQPSELVRRESNADESFRHYSINNGSESDSGGDPDCQQV